MKIQKVSITNKRFALRLNYFPFIGRKILLVTLINIFIIIFSNKDFSIKNSINMNPKSTEILNSAKIQLGFIKDSLEELKNNPLNAKINQKAFANIIIFGRSVTFVLQNLRSTVGKEAFDAWYLPFQKEMRDDPLLTAFKNARNNLEKQGKLQTSISLKMKNFDSSSFQKYWDKKPENALNFFIGDRLGGSGWEIQMPDGTKEKLYVELDLGPNIEVDIKVHFVHTPIYHKGKLMDDMTIENCSLLFYKYLKNLVDSAIFEFVIK